jgi:hypothetical protein
MEYALLEVHFPQAPASSFLAWASWWHRVDRSLVELQGEDLGREVEVLDRSTFWDRFLDTVSKEASRAMLRSDQSMEPVVRAPGREVVDATRIARARLAWLREGHGPASLRPDPSVTRMTQKLLTAMDAAMGVRSLSIR